MSQLDRFRLRPDLIMQPQDQAATAWVVKDPISLRFFLFGADEHFILQRLTGRMTARQIVEEFARCRAPRRLTAERLAAFVSSLHQSGLIASDTPGQGDVMLERAATERSRESFSQWTNLLAIRLPGVNPDPWLARLYPAVRWCFSTWALLLAAAICVAALAVVVGDVESFQRQWPRLDELLSARNLLWLAIALAGAKILHELGHAFTCTHFGGRCHELGLMLLVFTPCLYCNVTDAWMLRRRWQRIAISAAGIAVELLLASMAAIVWRYTQAGALHAIALNLVVVCSVGTILFNGNPLLKYDGYYILSDLVGIPNLWSESRAALAASLRRWLTRRPATVSEYLGPRRYFLIGYAVASIAYRIFLTGVILLFLYRWLEPHGLEVLLGVVAVSVAVQTVLAWRPRVAQWFSDPLRYERIRKGRAALIALLVGGLLAGLAIIRWPTEIEAPIVVQAAQAERIYVATPGLLRDAAAPGDVVAAGDVLARLQNDDLRDEQLRLQGELNGAEARARALRARVGDEQSAAAQLLVTEEIVADLKQQIALREQQAEQLVLRTPAAGEVIAPPADPLSVDLEQRLPRWEGTPLDRDNRGSFLERGVLLCLVVDPDSHEAVLFVDETDVPYLRRGQPTRVQLRYAPATILSGEVVEIAELNVEQAPPELAIPREIATRTRTGWTPLRTTYLVRVALQPTDVPLLVGARGRARVAVAPQTAWERFQRWWQRTIAYDAAQ